MSKLEQLIQELCPDGVEYKSIKECCKIETGKLNASDATEDGEYMFFTTAKETSKTNTYRWDTEALLIAGNANVGDVKHYIGKFNAYQRTYVLTEFVEGINVKFLYYSLSNNLKRYLDNHKNKAAMVYIVLSTLENFTLAAPPLEIQDEIVRILDDFTLHTAELTAELTARKEQYEYYEHKLIFNEKYKKVRLEELCIVNQGLQIPISQRKTEKGENRYFYITVQFLKGGNEEYYIENPPLSVICKEDDILVTRTGSTGKIITGVNGCFHNNFFKVTPNEKINKKYLYYVLNSKHMYNKMLSVASGGTVPDLPHKKFYNIEIPLPDIKEQEQIVSIMEKMYKLCNDISEGLPAEIEARQKQYEYYRDKLLTFKELKKEN